MPTKGRTVGSRKPTAKGSAAIDGTKAHCVWPVVDAKQVTTRTQKQLELERKTTKKPPR